MSVKIMSVENIVCFHADAGFYTKVLGRVDSHLKMTIYDEICYCESITVFQNVRNDENIPYMLCLQKQFISAKIGLNGLDWTV